MNAAAVRVLDEKLPSIAAALELPKGGLPLDQFTSLDAIANAIGRKDAQPSTVPAVECAIRVKSNLLATLPKYVGRINPETEANEREEGHPVNWVLQQPSAYMQPFAFWEWVFSMLVARGNVYALIRRDALTNTPLELIPAEWKTTEWVGDPMRPRRTNPARLTHLLSAAWQVSSTIARYDDADVLAINGHGFNPSSMRSPSPIQGHAAEVIDTLIAGIKRTHTIMREGGSTGKAIEFLPEAQFDLDTLLQVREDLKAHLGGIQSGLPVLPMGTRMSSHALSALDMQVIETLKFSIEDVSRIFNIPPRCIYHFHAGMRTSGEIEAQGTDTERYSIRPEANRAAAAMTAKLLTPAERMAGLRVCMPTDDIAEGTFSEQIRSLGPGVSNFGIITPNEARRRMGYAPVPNGDKLRAPRGGPAKPQLGDSAEGEE